MADIGWRTINGTPVYLGSKGTIMKGPSALVGKSVAEVSNQGGKLTYTQSTISEMGAANVAKNGDKVSKHFLETAKQKQKHEDAVKAKQEQMEAHKAKKAEDPFYDQRNVRKDGVTKDTKMYNGYEVPAEYITKTGLSNVGKEYYKSLVRQDPTKAKDPKSVQSAYSAKFKEMGLSKEMQFDVATYLKQGKSFDQAVKMAEEVASKFKSFHK